MNPSAETVEKNSPSALQLMLRTRSLWAYGISPDFRFYEMSHVFISPASPPVISVFIGVFHSMAVQPGCSYVYSPASFDQTLGPLGVRQARKSPPQRRSSTTSAMEISRGRWVPRRHMTMAEVPAAAKTSSDRQLTDEIT